ncbi:MAG: aromatic ring hydroxylase [Proteobacteria bacterium]|nr:aromatic ring hydroxylase [Pseudomonadota bacterium]
MLRTKEKYNESLFNMRHNVYIGGEAVGRDDHRLKPGVNVLDTTFELAQDPKYQEVATAVSTLNGERINRFVHLPQTPYDLVQKQKYIRIAARRVGGCIQRCMGCDGSIALMVYTKEVDDELGTDYHQRFLEYYKNVHANDLSLTCAQTDIKGDRLLRPSKQENPDSYVHIKEIRDDGIVVSGMKMSITAAAYVEELLVLPTRALMEDDGDYAVAFSIPADAEGVSLITRPVWLREKDDADASPFCKFGVSDSVVVFDDVFVPQERVFMCKEWKYGRRLALLFADSHRHSYSGCKPAISDILCGATALAAEANNIQKVSHVREKLTEFASSAELAFAAGTAAAVYGAKTASGVFFPNTIYANVGRKLTGEMIYHEYNLLTEIAGGISITLPFHEDFQKGDNVDHLKKFIVRNPKLSAEISLKIWKLVENIGESSMSSWYRVAGVHGGGSPIMEAIALGIEYDYEDKKELARYLGGINDQLDDSKLLELEPTFEIEPE